MAGRPLRPATDHRLGRPLPPQLANRPRAPPKASPKTLCSRQATPGRAHAELPRVSAGYPPPLGRSPTCSAPVRHVSPPKETPSDLHALGTPPALILSQDQTLHQNAPGREPLWLDSGAHCSTICLAVLSHAIDGIAPHQAPYAYLLRLRRAISIIQPRVDARSQARTAKPPALTSSSPQRRNARQLVNVLPAGRTRSDPRCREGGRRTPTDQSFREWDDRTTASRTPRGECPRSRA